MFDKHLENVITRVRPILYTLGRIMEFTDVKVYKSHVLPVLDFRLYLLDYITN